MSTTPHRPSVVIIGSVYSPWPFIFTRPQSSTVATPSLFELNFTVPVSFPTFREAVPGVFRSFRVTDPETFRSF